MGKRSTMDSKSKQERKVVLATKLAEERFEISSSREILTREMGAAQILKHSLKKNPIPWFAGAFGTAIVTSFVFRRPSDLRKRRSPIGLLFSLGFNLAKPALIKWGLDFAKLRLANYLDDQGEQSSNSKLGG